MAHYAIAKKADKVTKYLADADAGTGEVVKILAPADARVSRKLREQLHQAVTKQDRIAAAESSVTIFRNLIDRLENGTLVAPKEVESLEVGSKTAKASLADKT